MRRLLFLLPGLLFTGCLPIQLLDPAAKESNVLLVPSNPFSAPGPVTTTTSTKVNYGPGDKELALRVDRVGRQILTANPEIGMQPRFAIYGTPNPELFHTGPYLIHITDGLVKKCTADGQLAALLANEMAGMVVEREALANPRMRAVEKTPPAEVLIGNGFSDRDPDQSRLAELARYEKKPKQEYFKSPPLPDPDKLARVYLEKAGYDPGLLEEVQPLLKEAERTYILEKQYKQFGGMTGWTASRDNDKDSPATPGASGAPVPPGPVNLELPATLEEGPTEKPPSPWQAGPK